jgi:DNA-binding PadR family transcriptional regulator
MWHGWKHRGQRGLRHWIIAILRRSPKNGAEIMDEIEGMTQGWWRPSPGSVYPLLDGMVTDGLIKKMDDGRYELTETTRRESEWPFGPGFMNPFGPSFGASRNIEDMLNEIQGYVSYFEDMAKTSKDKLTPHIEKMRTLTDRLTALTK